MIRLFLATLAILAVASDASAAARRHHPAPSGFCYHFGFLCDCKTRACEGGAVRPLPRQIRPARSADIVEHPAGCPRSAFCGCGAAVKIFGRPVRELWLAAAWFKFPRSAPAPMTAAVRRHHVFVLLEHVGGDVWRVYDANSGGGATRVHQRSIAGYTIVNPRGA